MMHIHVMAGQICVFHNNLFAKATTLLVCCTHLNVVLKYGIIFRCNSISFNYPVSELVSVGYVLRIWRYLSHLPRLLCPSLLGQGEKYHHTRNSTATQIPYRGDLIKFKNFQCTLCIYILCLLRLFVAATDTALNTGIRQFFRTKCKI